MAQLLNPDSRCATSTIRLLNPNTRCTTSVTRLLNPDIWFLFFTPLLLLFLLFNVTLSQLLLPSAPPPPLLVPPFWFPLIALLPCRSHSPVPLIGDPLPGPTSWSSFLVFLFPLIDPFTSPLIDKLDNSPFLVSPRG